MKMPHMFKVVGKASHSRARKPPAPKTQARSTALLGFPSTEDSQAIDALFDAFAQNLARKLIEPSLTPAKGGSASSKPQTGETG